MQSFEVIKFCEAFSKLQTKQPPPPTTLQPVIQKVTSNQPTIDRLQLSPTRQ